MVTLSSQLRLMEQSFSADSDGGQLVRRLLAHQLSCFGCRV
ncbi:MAG: hypothetical protein Q9P01_04890 [Anaerolineae bacterium]|nr:hypothetical protein [Anaerolineae bacterium]